MPKNFSSTAKGMTTLLRNSAPLVAPGSFQMDQFCPGSVLHMVYFQYCTLLSSTSPSAQEKNVFQVSLYLRLPLFPILGNNWKTKVNSISTRILLQETTPKGKTHSPTQQEKLTLHRDRKDNKSGTVLPVGSSFISEFSAFRAAEKQHRRD